MKYTVKTKKNRTPQKTKIIQTKKDLYEEVEITTTRKIKSILDLLETYMAEAQDSESTKNATHSCFLRNITPALGGKKAKSKRLSASEIEQAKLFLSGKKVGILQEAPDKLESYLEKPRFKKSQKSNIRSALKRITEWATEQSLVEIAASEEEEKQSIELFRHGHSPELKHPGWRGKNVENLKLGNSETHFVQDLENQPLDTIELENWKRHFSHLLLLTQSHQKLCIAIGTIELTKISPTLYLGSKELDQQISQFVQFLSTRMNFSEATIQRDLDEILRLLKWIYSSQEVPLEKLNLHLIIPNAPTPRYYKLKDFQQKYPDNLAQAQQEWAMTKVLAMDRLEEAAQEAEELMRTYLESKNISYKSRVNYLKSIINLAKSFYANQTKKFKRTGGFDDIDVIVQLRQLQIEYEEQSQREGEEARNKRYKREKISTCSWEDIYMASDLAFVKYEEEYRYMVTTTTKARRKNSEFPRVRKAKRTELARARDFQNALMLAIAVALPPGRSKVYYLMEPGRTLIKGLWLNGNFVPYEDLPDDKKPKAIWILDLTPSDGKAGTIDAEGWTCEIPDRMFSTKKTLYQYIEEWIDKDRNVFEPQHNYLYTNEKGKPMDSTAYGHKFRRAMRRMTGYSNINPHLLRSILITYAHERGMTDEQKRALAKLQRHSEETQEKNYNEIEEMKAMQPALAMMAEFNDEIERKYSRLGKNYDLD